MTTPLALLAQFSGSTSCRNCRWSLQAGRRNSDARWAAAPQALRDAVVARGFAVTRAIHPSRRLGDFYGSLRDDRASWVVTLDALFFVTHLAVDRRQGSARTCRA